MKTIKFLQESFETKEGFQQEIRIYFTYFGTFSKMVDTQKRSFLRLFLKQAKYIFFSGIACFQNQLVIFK